MMDKEREQQVKEQTILALAHELTDEMLSPFFVRNEAHLFERYGRKSTPREDALRTVTPQLVEDWLRGKGEIPQAVAYYLLQLRFEAVYEDVYYDGSGDDK